MRLHSPTKTIATAFRRLWASITLADLDTDIKASMDASLTEWLERQRIDRFWQDIEGAGIVLRRTDPGWTVHHRALLAADTGQPDPFATRETALLWAVYALMRAVQLRRLDLAIALPPQPRTHVATLDDLPSALDALGLVMREQRGEQYWRALERRYGIISATERAESRTDWGWFATHALLHRWLDARTSVTHQRLAEQTLAAGPDDVAMVSILRGPYVSREETLVTAIRELLAEFDALSARADQSIGYCS